MEVQMAADMLPPADQQQPTIEIEAQTAAVETSPPAKEREPITEIAPAASLPMEMPLAEVSTERLDEQPATVAAAPEVERVELDVEPLLVAPLELPPSPDEVPPRLLEHAPIPIEPLFGKAHAAPPPDDEARQPAACDLPASEAAATAVSSVPPPEQAGESERSVEQAPDVLLLEQETTIVITAALEAMADVAPPAVKAETPIPPEISAAAVTSGEGDEALPVTLAAEDAEGEQEEKEEKEELDEIAVSVPAPAAAAVELAAQVVTIEAAAAVASEESSAQAVVVAEQLVEALPASALAAAEVQAVAEVQIAATEILVPDEELPECMDEPSAPSDEYEEHAVLVIEHAPEPEVAVLAEAAEVETQPAPAVAVGAAETPAAPNLPEQTAAASTNEPTAIDLAIERAVLAAEHEIAVIEGAPDAVAAAEVSQEAPAHREATMPPESAPVLALSGAASTEMSPAAVAVATALAPTAAVAEDKPAWWIAPTPAPAQEIREAPRHETDILAGAWESAVATPGSGIGAGGLRSKAYQAAEAEHPDPADFLLEPLEAAGGTSAAGAPAPETGDAIAEIEDELFAPIEEAPVQAMEIAPPQPAGVAQPETTAGATSEAPPVADVATATLAPLQTPAATLPAQPALIPQPVLAPAAAQARPAAKPMPRPAPNDPLAALKAMSDEERIALFT
jgi:hypothetical protein